MHVARFNTLTQLLKYLMLAGLCTVKDSCELESE